MTAPLNSRRPSDHDQDLSARARVICVATHDPATLPDQDLFAWTGRLTDRQRQQMGTEAEEVLREGEEHGDWSVAEALAADWRVAEKLLALPDVVATLPPNWRVSDAWFWMPQWQALEQEANEDIAAGRLTRHKTDEEFLTTLRARHASHAHAQGD